MMGAQHTPHDVGLTDGCPRCLELALKPTQNLDSTMLGKVVGLAAMRGERFNTDANELELIAAKHCLDALEQVGRMMEANTPAVLAYFREAWRIDVGGPR